MLSIFSYIKNKSKFNCQKTYAVRYSIQFDIFASKKYLHAKYRKQINIKQNKQNQKKEKKYSLHINIIDI